MSRISFTSEIEEIIGKLAGSVFQDSYIGLQVRGLVTPSNPQTQLQQLRRGDFRFLTSNWRNLSPTDQSSWAVPAGSVPEGLRLYIGNNINLILIGINIISTFVNSSAPPTITLSITQLSTTVFNVIALGSITTVPSGTKLLIFATYSKSPSKIFTNPKEFQPIVYFDEGTDLSTVTDISAAWSNHYGTRKENDRICIKSALINKSNGNRTDNNIACEIITDSIALMNFTVLITTGLETVEFLLGAGTVTDTIVINWGDGNIEPFTGGTTNDITHVYAANGTYIIDIKITTLTTLYNFEYLTGPNVTQVNFLNTNISEMNMAGQFLSSSYVNYILAQCILSPTSSGTVNTGAQTPAAPPTGQGIIDAAALLFKGWVVTTD